MSDELKHGISLVQRVNVRRSARLEGFNKDIKSIDHYFEMDYMGSSEFEWGTIPQALKRMRARAQMDDFVTEPQRIKVAGQYVAWFVGPMDQFNIAKALFIDQLGLAGERQRLKELSYIRDNYVDLGSPGTMNGVALRSKFAKSRDDFGWYDGWWAVDDTVAFAFFKTKEDAKIWIHCVFNGVSAPTPGKAR